MSLATMKAEAENPMPQRGPSPVKPVHSGPGPRKRKRSPLLWTAIGTVLGLFLLYMSTRKVDFAAVSGMLESVVWPYAAGILVAMMAFIVMKAWRWGMLLRFAQGLRFGELHAAVYIGLAVNFLVAHVGEVLRTAFVARRNRIAASAVLASVLIERAMDFIALLALLALVIAFDPKLPHVVIVAGMVSGGVVVLAFLGLYSLLEPPAWLERLAILMSRPVPEPVMNWVRAQLESFRRGLAALKDARLLALAIVSSIVQWSLVVAAILFSGFAIGQPVSIVAATVTFVLIVLGLALPNSPMQVGTTQLAFVIGFGTDGTDATAAIAASLVYTLFLIVPIMFVGGVMAMRYRPKPELRLR